MLVYSSTRDGAVCWCILVVLMVLCVGVFEYARWCCVFVYSSTSDGAVRVLVYSSTRDGAVCWCIRVHAMVLCVGVF